MLFLQFLMTSNTEYKEDMDIGCRLSISFWYSAVLYTSQVLEVVKMQKMT